MDVRSLIALDPASAAPPFEQVRSQVMDAVSSGALVAGSRMPTVRRLADDLGLAPGTVARAYRELEASGFIETRGRNGSFVSPQGDAAVQQAQRAATAFAEQIRSLNLDVDQALALVSAALRA
ncbi:GntR family transcriptional regulator [Microbacterium memoriense]|uniref:GntR family transcriptional regulator n=1 Tax=Microbacterium memoriense TaxID=2978350 RepID=A0ABT2P905_9MICO|nr:GntR family transcriptional regulator [Microbacterium memoriense]MCT9001122.1 GntR family transcriptional regulator [Microbacterium memoriense]